MSAGDSEATTPPQLPLGDSSPSSWVLKLVRAAAEGKPKEFPRDLVREAELRGENNALNELCRQDHSKGLTPLAYATAAN